MKQSKIDVEWDTVIVLIAVLIKQLGGKAIITKAETDKVALLVIESTTLTDSSFELRLVEPKKE